MPSGEGILAGRRVLIVEDEYFLADDLRQILHDQRAEILGPAATIARAFTLINAGEPIDCAVLDVNLCGEAAYPISAALRQRKIPFLFATGYGSAQIPDEFANIVRLEKPIDRATLVSALKSILA
jgi:response regulator RpfG family c-di-GMP phosphodiesterase